MKINEIIRENSAAGTTTSGNVAVSIAANVATSGKKKPKSDKFGNSIKQLEDVSSLILRR